MSSHDAQIVQRLSKKVKVKRSKALRAKPELVAADQSVLPTVSVVIPCFNYARYLRAAIDSALNQIDANVEVIVVDDASTDESMAVATSVAKSDRRVRVVGHAKNAGPVQTFNDGLDLVTGEFLVRLDADDLLTPGSLRRSIEVMRAFPSVGLVYGHPLHFAGDRVPRAREIPSYWTVWPGLHWLRSRCRDACNVITSPEVLMRSKVVSQVGGQKDLAHTHDMEMWFRIAAYSDVAYIHGADQAWHRDHEMSLSAREVDHFRDLQERYEAFVVLFAGLGKNVPGVEKMSVNAFDELARQAIEFSCREIDCGRGGEVATKRFIDLARDIKSELEELPIWNEYLRRLRVSPSRAKWQINAIVARIARKVDRLRRVRRWHRDGVFAD